MRFVLILLLYISTYASTLELNYAQTKFDDFSIEYIKDPQITYTVEDIKKMDFKEISNQNAFAGKIGSIWYRLKIKNTTDIEREVFIHNNLAYYSKEIMIYQFTKSKLVNQDKFNILDTENNKLIGSTLVYSINIDAQTEVTLYIRNIAMVSSLFDLRVYDQKSSLNAFSLYSTSSVMIISIMMTLALYNTVLYFFNRRKEFLLYALYLITPAIGLTYKYGIVFSYFHLYGESTYWFNLTAILMPAFLIFFIKETLNTKEMDKKINYVLNTLLFIIALNIIIALINLTFAMEAFKFMFLITTFVLIYLIIHLFKISHHLAIIFTTAYTFYILGLLITILAMSGVIELNFFTFHSGGFGIIIEGLLFSYLIHHNMKTLEHKIREQREIIITKNKKAQLGDMISSITHQWKQPLSRVTSITSLLEFKHSKNIEITNEELLSSIGKINSDIHFLSTTIDDFKDFFNPNNILEEADIAKIINNTIAISSDDTLSKEIIIKTDLNFDHTVNTYKNELMHIILNILQNSKEAFKSSKESVKIIKIFGYMQNEKIYIDIIDNAGGIKEESLPFIFNEHYTTKKKKSGSGLGLYISKIILENHLQGTIEVTNTNDGTMFRIII